MRLEGDLCDLKGTRVDNIYSEGNTFFDIFYFLFQLSKDTKSAATLPYRPSYHSIFNSCAVVSCAG